MEIMKQQSITIGREEVKAILHRAETGQIGAADAPLVVNLSRLVLTLWQVIDEKKESIARLRKLLFGPKSEKRHHEQQKAESNNEHTCTTDAKAENQAAATQQQQQAAASPDTTNENNKVSFR